MITSPYSGLPKICAWAVLALVVLFDQSVQASGIAEFSERDKRLLATLSLYTAVPPQEAVSNRFANDQRARKLGQALFFDPRLSGEAGISCATCHQPERYFTDGLPRSQGVGTTLRNAPTIVGTAYYSWFYWDGRRDSLWAQALIPIEAADEMGGSRLAAVRLMGEAPEYRSQYEELFGPFPDEILQPDLPEHAGPFGNPDVRRAWQTLSREQRRAINIAYANMGKAIAAYERTQMPQPTRFDRFVQNLLTDQDKRRILSENEIAGLRLFIDSEKTACLQCHNGPMFTNGGFHNIGTGNFSGERLDYGRVFGLRAVLMDEFNCKGPYSDAEPIDCLELNFLNTDSHIPLDGAFKVPGLRGLAKSGPYFHDGRFESLEAVIDYYITAPQELAPNSHELRTLDLSAEDQRNLVEFLLTLSGERSPTDAADDTRANDD